MQGLGLSTLLLLAVVQAQAGTDASWLAAVIAEGGTAAAVGQAAQAPIRGIALNQDAWSVVCESQTATHRCEHAIDGKNNTFWQSLPGAGSPQSITVSLGATQQVNAIQVAPRQDSSNEGIIGRHRISLSQDGATWDEVAYGTWWMNHDPKTASFEPQLARYVRFTAISASGNTGIFSISEINVWAANATIVQDPGNKGVWGPTIDLPLVPVAGGVDPLSGKVVMWSSWGREMFTDSPGGVTQTAIWDPKTRRVTHRRVNETVHDMFCPGISHDQDGNMIVTGGAAPDRISIFNGTTQKWVMGASMVIPRGYQSSVALSDGTIFSLGGSWSGGELENKYGELYDPVQNISRGLRRANASVIATGDKAFFRRDNHPWLFGWKNGTVFHAGPSHNMHWYTTSGNGSVRFAGARGSDPDAMCGSAVMYDALAGKILSFGGAPNYNNDTATTNTNIITIDDPTERAQVRGVTGMKYRRIFHNSVVLPDGSVFTTGGQRVGIIFSEKTAHLTPERFDPSTEEWQEWQKNSIIRVYHSFALLLPDATVFSAGGGLCGTCPSNHFDGQVFTPPYLIGDDGELLTRPVINDVFPPSALPGTLTRISTDTAVSSASLVRYGTATHTANTDQRRIPLTLTLESRDEDGYHYKFSLPDDLGVAIPGYYMLFVMNESGVPSVSATIRIHTP